MRLLPDRLPTRVEAAVLLAGTASMGLEILAGRVVAPTFGSSIYTWGSIIGVFLTALSLGYHHGGRGAASASRDRLAGVLGLATVFVALFVAINEQVLAAAVGLPLPMRFVPLLPIAILFGPPTYLLGFVSPYAAELSTKQRTGAASGHVYALGTVGSIVGSFGTTFLLVPSLRVELVAMLFGGLLLAAALGVATRTPAQLAGLATAGLVLVAAVGVGIYGAPGEDVIYRTQTPYQQLEVVDDGDIRTLYLDGHPHSAMDTNDPYRHVFEYTRYFHLPLLFAEDVDKVLFVGGGGFTGPKIFAHKYDVEVDVVELDPEVIRAAKEYFRVEESPDFDIHQGAGRRFLRNSTEQYDLIVLDAYRKAQVPFQLTTVEFLELAKQHLTSDGVLLANVISAPSGPASKFARAQYKTMARVFPQVYAFPTEGSTAVQNVELVATMSGDRVTEAELRRRYEARDVGVDLSTAISHHRASLNTADVPVLRDDHAPVSRLLRSNVGREYTVDRTNETETPA